MVVEVPNLSSQSGEVDLNALTSFLRELTALITGGLGVVDAGAP